MFREPAAVLAGHSFCVVCNSILQRAVHPVYDVKLQKVTWWPLRTPELSQMPVVSGSGNLADTRLRHFVSMKEVKVPT